MTTETVTISGNQLAVTPVHELPFPQSAIVGILVGRIEKTAADESFIEAHDAWMELVQLVIDEPIRTETIEELPAQDIETILNAAVPEDVREDRRDD